MAQSSWLMSEPQKSEGLKLVGMVVQPSSIETMQIVLSCQSRLSFDPDGFEYLMKELEVTIIIERDNKMLRDDRRQQMDRGCKTIDLVLKDVIEHLNLSMIECKIVL
ncbi:hypothetical protein SDJN02_24036, partial [Cucurbita argyrosperma subsp. argyrosperma]